MKKLFKLLAVFIMTLALTGCMKIRYQINITGKDNADVNMTMLYSKETRVSKQLLYYHLCQVLILHGIQDFF